MYVLQSEKETITSLVINECERREIVLKEKTRQILIAKTIKAFRETNGDEMYMRTVLEAELTLIPALLPKTPTSNFGVVVVTTHHDINAATMIRLTDHLTKAGVKLSRDGYGYFVRLPRSYDAVSMCQHIRKIIRGDA